MSCCSGGIKFYEVVENGILVTKEETKMSMWAIARHTHRIFGMFKPESFRPITCQKHISSKFDGAISHMQEENDWKRNPVCGAQYLPEKELVRMYYTKREEMEN